ncbi:MAG: tape measure protein [Lachnospiraceae bacterium]|nr:tape measure protein [Lachnospiraceae bacterium]
MAESYSVTAILSARDKNFSSVFGSAQGAADSLAKKLTGGLGFGVLAGVGMKAFSMVTSAASGFTGELEGTSAAWKTFEDNFNITSGIKNVNRDISGIKKELQSFATKTIYSASDMATTFSQLDAVGIESAEKLVKGFGGIAAAAENPAQAMKTLSQQGVQMAAKPTVAWQDFKLMLEQTPAGIAAVADEMGMTASELVQAVQDGKVATKDFFEAIKTVGASEESEFAKMATRYKTVGQAMDGLSETVTNKVMPAFEVFQGIGIDAVEKIIDKLDAIDGEAIASEIQSIADAFKDNGITGVIEKVSGYVDKLPEGLKVAAAAAGALAGVSLTNGLLNSGAWEAGTKGIGLFMNKMGSLPGAVGRGVQEASRKLAGFNPATAVKKSLIGVRTSFTGFGSFISNFGGDIAESMEAISPKLSGAGLKVWEAFDSFGGNLSSKASAIVSDVGFGFAGITSKMGDAASKISKRAKSIAKPFKTVLGGITGVLGKVGGAVMNVGGKLASGLQSMMGLALKALMPAAVIGVVLAGLGLLYSKFGDQIDGILQMAQEKGPQFITNLVAGITSRIPALIASGAQLISGLLDTITANIPAVIAGGVSIVTTLVAGVASAAPGLIGKATELIGTFVLSIVSALPQLITSGMQLLESLAQGIGQNLPVLAQYAMQAIMSFAQGLISNLPQILASAVQIVQSLVTGIVNMIPVLISSGIQLITYLAQSFIQNLPMIIQTGIQVIGALVMGLIQAVPMIIQGAIELVKSLVDTILNTDWIKVGGDIIDAIGNGIKNGFGGLGSLITGLFSNDTSAQDGGAQQAARAAESTAQAYISNSGLVSSAANQVGTEATTNLTAGLGSGAAEVSNIMSTMATDGVSAFSESFAGVDMSGIGADLSNSISTEFDSGLSQLPVITSNAGSQVASSMQQSGTQVVAAVKSTTTSVVNTLKSGVSPATVAGRSTGNGYTQGVRGASGAARSAGAAVKNAGLNGMSGGYGAAYSHGANIGQGLADGMWSKVGAAWAAAESLAAAADKAIHARAQIGSPSKITKKYGRFFGQGFPIGMDHERKNVIDAANRLGQSMIDSIDRKVQAARNAMTELINYASPEAVMSRRSNSLNLNDDYEYKSEAHYTIVVESVMDGRKVGEGVADYVGDTIEKKNAREARKRGRT